MTPEWGSTLTEFPLAKMMWSRPIYALVRAFFFDYVLIEVPSNDALHRFGARKWIARIVLS